MQINENQEKKIIESLIDNIPGTSQHIECSGIYGSEKAYLVSRLYQKLKKSLAVVLSSPKETETFIEDLNFFSKKLQFPILYFIPYNILPFKFVSYHNKTSAERIRVLYNLMNHELPVITITTINALQQKIIPRQELSDFAELIMTEEETDRDFLIEKLVAGGYVRTAIVEEPGDFCVRGGILDVFSPLYSEPLRIEFFGDMVESLRLFSASTQRTLKPVKEAVILPAKETILKMEEFDGIFNRIRKQAARSDIPANQVRDIIEQIQKNGIYSGIESLSPLIYPKLDSLFDYMPDDSIYILSEPEKLEQAAIDFSTQALNNYSEACARGKLCVEPDMLYMGWPEIEKKLEPEKSLSIKMLSVSKTGSEPSGQDYFISIQDNSIIRTSIESSKEKENLFLPLADRINKHRQMNYAVLLVSSTQAQTDHLASILASYGIEVLKIDGFFDIQRAKGMVYICEGQLSAGFVWPEASLSIITEAEIFGKKRAGKIRRKHQVRSELLTFEDLNIGDLVVHDEHGIGRYEGLSTLKLNGTSNDFLLIVYKDGDKLYLPVERMGMAQKYMGVDGIEPVLDKMGGASWGKVREKVKKSVEKIAGELLKLYAERRVKEGFAFKISDSDFHEFEAGFQYEETPDQLKAIDDVLYDMAQPEPMDRLVCGDVGYGKTEVALRASFAVVNNNKQAAVLVPTTVLAEQHYETFSSRYENYPVKVSCLSRFRSIKEQQTIVEGLKTGEIDIVIGTHRLLQKDISFKDLGLIVLDEEQRFGVKHKEKLKKLRSSVDVLALTATPIPRTLHLSLMGIRDISIISTPPEQRHPIITYISEFDESIIVEALRKELKRNGQIFFVHNNINTIKKTASHLKTLVPEIRVAMAHGRMNEDELEQVMFRFMNKEIDLLVCTTIIESGLDVPAANTIIVNRADRFGLAQIYQLRGRVGRAGEQAYAYLFIPNESVLTKDAQKRLKVLMEHSDLGSGFQIAMSDLKIRGGGTILGASQSGHIAAVGYDMFLKLMEDAVSHIKGEPAVENLAPEINISLSAFISEDYIPDISQRLTAYRRLSKMNTLKEIASFKSELIDRFGPLTDETANLLLKIMLRVLAVNAGVKRLDITENRLLLYFSESHQKNPFGIVDMIVSEKERFEFTTDHVLKVKLIDQKKAGSVLAQTKNILKEITQRVNN